MYLFISVLQGGAQVVVMDWISVLDHKHLPSTHSGAPCQHSALSCLPGTSWDESLTPDTESNVKNTCCGSSCWKNKFSIVVSSDVETQSGHSVAWGRPWSWWFWFQELKLKRPSLRSLCSSVIGPSAQHSRKEPSQSTAETRWSLFSLHLQPVARLARPEVLQLPNSLLDLQHMSGCDGPLFLTRPVNNPFKKNRDCPAKPEGEHCSVEDRIANEVFWVWVLKL